jgi:ubiquinone/menaquinone biosynthesis C-methylase UbiE
VLEIGIGSGLNLPLYGTEVDRVYGIDPSVGLLRRAAQQPGKAVTELVEASAEAIPFEDLSFDTVLTTWTMCTIPQVMQSLGEMRRVLRRNGRLLFVEHGLAPDRTAARWQRRLTPCWRCVSGGCHFDRDIHGIIAAAGFAIERLDTGYLGARNPLIFMYEGVARPAV